MKHPKFILQVALSLGHLSFLLTGCGESEISGETFTEARQPGNPANPARVVQVDCKSTSAKVLAQSTNLPNGSLSVSCNALSSLYDSGTALCTAENQPWDVSQCHVIEHTDQYVYPRDLNSDRWPNAVCNDGNSFAFTISFPVGYNALSPADRARVPYQIELQGGGQCVPRKDLPTDTEPCETRAQKFLGPYTDSGLMFPKASDGNPTGDQYPTQNLPAGQPRVDKGLENAIKIWGHYCSSDVWSGQNLDAIADNMAATEDSTHYGPTGMFVSTPNVNRTFAHWPMTGHFNVRSMIDAVTERFGMVDTNSSLRIHLRGQSAGGYGVMTYLPELATRFPNALSRTQNGMGGIQGSSWQSWIPIGFEGTVHTDGSSQFSPTLKGIEDHAAPTVWNTFASPACRAAGKTPGQCLFATTMVDYISQPAGTSTNLGPSLGIPLLVYMNRQDEGHYMPFAGILQLNSQGQAVDINGATNTTAAAEQAAARKEWIRLLNIEMGLQNESNSGLITGTVTASSRLRWLFTPSDPQLPKTGNQEECNVHAPLDWLAWLMYDGSNWVPHNYANTGAPPDSNPANTLELMTERFWNSYGMSSEIHAYNGTGQGRDLFSSIDYVTKTGPCDK